MNEMTKKVVNLIKKEGKPYIYKGEFVLVMTCKDIMKKLNIDKYALRKVDKNIVGRFLKKEKGKKVLFRFIKNG